MRRTALPLVTAVLLLVSHAVGGTVVTPTTTLAAETANNTSAAGAFAGLPNGNIAAGNVSKVNTRPLLYPGASTRIYAHLMLWFGGSNHVNVGYRSDDATQVKRQIDDMLSRGIEGAIIDWYGPNGTRENDGSKLLMSDAETRNGQFVFAIMEDVGALKTCAATAGCDLTQQVISDLTYVNSTFAASPAYMRFGGRPAIFFFGLERYVLDWVLIKASVPGNPLLIFQNASGFTHLGSDGAFSWVGVNSSNPADWGQGYVDNFYSTALGFPALLTFASAKKGFDDTIASWSANRIMNQDCGQTWLKTFAEIARYHDSARQLDALQLVTWNDYEEGTAIESGIDNCVRVFSSVAGERLDWQITGNENTVDHYVIFVSADGRNLMPLAEVPAGTHTLSLADYQLPDGVYQIFVKALGKPSLSNQTSPAAAYVQPPVLALSTSPQRLNMARGQSASAVLTITPQPPPFDQDVQLTCTGLPAGMTCSFSPSTLRPGMQSVSSTLTISAATVSARKNRRPAALALALSLIAGSVITLRLRRGSLTVVLALALGLQIIALACSGGGGGAGGSSAVPSVPASGGAIASNPQTIAVTVTATAPSLQRSTTLVVELH